MSPIRPYVLTNEKRAQIIRASAYSVASVLAILMLTAALPPITADQSDRAILDAPITLLTSPISGEISALDVSVGDRMEEGARAAEVTNTRVDRTTLMMLQGKADDARLALEAARNKRASDLHYVKTMDEQIAAQKTQLIKQYDDQSVEYAGELTSAKALVDEKSALHDRQTNLVARNISDPYMLKPTSEQLSGAQGMRAAAAAKLNANTEQKAAVQSDVFVGDNLVGIATLAQKRRDIAFDADRQSIEQTRAAASLNENTDLVDAERARIGLLAKATLKAPADAEVLHVGVAPGRHVNAGDALVNLVNCNRLFAVGIFSYRQATNLSPGTRVTISGEGVSKPVEASVSEIIPKSSDTTDALYALPFPQTERREMYVVAKLDGNIDLLRGGDGHDGTGACPVGRWVTITRADGWMPSSSVIWHRASDVVTSMLKAIVAPTASAQPRHIDKS